MEKHTFMSVFLILLSLFVASGKATDDGISKEKCTTCLSGICATDETLKCDCVRGYKIDITNKNVVVFPKGVASLAFVLDMSRSMEIELRMFKEPLSSVVELLAYDPIFKDIIFTTFSGRFDRESQFVLEVGEEYDKIKGWVEREFGTLDNSGGCKNYVFRALKQTAEAANRASVIFLLTDSISNDATLAKEVDKLLKDKEIRLFHLRSGITCASHDSVLDNLVKTYGQTYNIEDYSSDKILKYLRVAFQYGLSFMRSPPKKFEDLKYISKGTCKCKNEVVRTTQCRDAFPSSDTKNDGVKLDLTRIGSVHYGARFPTSEYMPSRAIDSYDNTYAYTASETGSHWFMVQLWRFSKVQSVKVTFKPMVWLNNQSDVDNFKKISVGLSDKVSIWSKFEWKEFKKCGNTYNGAGITKTTISHTQTFSCAAPFNSVYMRYVAVYKEAVSGKPNILKINHLRVLVLDNSGRTVDLGLRGSECQMDGYNQKAIKIESAFDGDLNTYYRSVTVSAREQYYILDTMADRLISKIVLHRRKTEEARLQFRGIFAAISDEPKEDSFDQSKYNQCDDFYEGPPATSVTAVPFYCTLNKKTRVVGVLKTGVMETYNILELTEIEVYLYRASLRE